MNTIIGLIGPGAVLHVNTDTGDFRLYVRDNEHAPPYDVPEQFKRAVALVASRTAYNRAHTEGNVRAQYIDTARGVKLNTISASMSREGDARTRAKRVTEILEAIVGPLYELNETSTGRTRPITLSDVERDKLKRLTWGEW